MKLLLIIVCSWLAVGVCFTLRFAIDERRRRAAAKSDFESTRLYSLLLLVGLWPLLALSYWLMWLDKRDAKKAKRA